MAWLNITDRTGADPNASADIDQLMENERVMGGNGNNAPTGDLTDHETRIDALEISTAYTISLKTEDYTILDDDGIGTVEVDSRTGQKTITFPTAADNVNRTISVVVRYVGGAVICDGEGAETFEAGDNSVASIYLMNKGDKLVAQCDGTVWLVKELHTELHTGGINTSDWTNRHLGSSNLTYDNLTGTFTVGEKVIEYSDAGRTTPTGVYGWIISDSGVILVLKNVAGIGVFTNNFYLKGETSLATADVNGNTKNQDTNITHMFGVPITDLDVKFLYDEDTTFTKSTAKEFPGSYSVNNFTYGMQTWGIDVNNVKIQTADTGFFAITDSGGFNQIDTEDYSYYIIVRWII